MDDYNSPHLRHIINMIKSIDDSSRLEPLFLEPDLHRMLFSEDGIKQRRGFLKFLVCSIFSELGEGEFEAEGEKLDCLLLKYVELLGYRIPSPKTFSMKQRPGNVDYVIFWGNVLEEYLARKKVGVFQLDTSECEEEFNKIVELHHFLEPKPSLQETRAFKLAGSDKAEVMLSEELEDVIHSLKKTISRFEQVTTEDVSADDQKEGYRKAVEQVRASRTCVDEQYDILLKSMIRSQKGTGALVDVGFSSIEKVLDSVVKLQKDIKKGENYQEDEK